jgi:hypothetical protein
MNEKTIYERPQVEVVDAYPEKAYCSYSGEPSNVVGGEW